MGDDSAYGLSIEMPNSEGWKGEAAYKVIEENYNPALGFANRTDIPRLPAISATPGGPRQWFRASRAASSGSSSTRSTATSAAGDRGRAHRGREPDGGHVEVSQFFFEERLVEPFEISEGIVIPAGD